MTSLAMLDAACPGRGDERTSQFFRRCRFIHDVQHKKLSLLDRRRLLRPIIQQRSAGLKDCAQRLRLAFDGDFHRFECSSVHGEFPLTQHHATQRINSQLVPDEVNAIIAARTA